MAASTWLRPLALLGEGTIGALFAAVPCRQQSQQAVVAVKFMGDHSLTQELLADGGWLARELYDISGLSGTRPTRLGHKRAASIGAVPSRLL